MNKLSEKLLVEDECMTMPKLFTYVNIKPKNVIQKIQIDEDCKDYASNWPKRVKRFISFIRIISEAKPEIRDAPQSDVMYL